MFWDFDISTNANDAKLDGERKSSEILTKQQTEHKSSMKIGYMVVQSLKWKQDA